MDTDVYNMFVAVTTSDTVDLPFVTHAVWFGGAGNAAVVRQDGVVVTITGITAGELLPIAVKRINAASTTATNILALRVI